MAPAKRRSSDGETERLWRLAGLGGTMASEIIAGTLIGWVLDRVFHTKPTLLIVGSSLGVVVGLTTFIRRAMIETGKAGREATRIAGTIERTKAESAETDPDDEWPDDDQPR